MLRIFIAFDPATAARIDRVMNYLEGQQRAEFHAALNAIASQMEALGSKSPDK